MRKIKVLHIEPTDVCQLACPLCAREIDPNFDKSKKHHLRIEQIQHHLSDKIIRGLDKMFMCGNYGDPAAGFHTLDIYRYFRTVNPAIVLGMNTNGALQSTFWWHNLGQLFNQPLDYCVFSIDGLEHNNAVYRVNSNWNKLISNIKAFVAAGGSAHWDMLVYQHNQHQVDDCEAMARELGFKWFRAKVSKRPLIGNLKLPSGWKLPQHQPGKIKCHALVEKSMYIDAQGRLSPCCWLGARQRDFVTDDLKTVKLTWKTKDPDPTCADSCTVNNNHTLFEHQWQREVQLC